MNATIHTLPGIPTKPPAIELPDEPTPPDHFTPTEVAAWQAGLDAGRAERDFVHNQEVALHLATVQSFINEQGPRPTLTIASMGVA